MPDEQALAATKKRRKEAAATPPPPPVEMPIPPDWPHRELYEAVRSALEVVPGAFQSDIHVSGALATDVFNFNSALGASIETQVVATLNDPRLRSIWDPQQAYHHYLFVRQSQQFPDVILRNMTNPGDIIMGIELKGWYALAKEGEPSFRFQATPAVCNPWDLLVVYPWALSQVVSGKPQLYPPFIRNARYAAEYRNYHWLYGIVEDEEGTTPRRRPPHRSSAVIQEPRAYYESLVGHPYPVKSEEYNDEGINDKGGNFGRFARTNLMDDYRRQLFEQPLSGIPLGAWLSFFKRFVGDATSEQLARILPQLEREYRSSHQRRDAEAIRSVTPHLLALIRALEQQQDR
jgi:hypothetical protein